MKTLLHISIFLVILVAAAGMFEGQDSRPAASLNDPVTRLSRQIERGEASLEYRAENWGYLRSLLEHLDIHIDSQVLVFSKTSFQLSRISPRTPRALYFNDNAAVGAVQGGSVFELTSLDPAQGLIYYTMDTAKADKPRFERRFEECLNCHGPANGLIVSSVFPSPEGTPFVTGTFFGGIDHRTLLEDRWGGWYVSGTHGRAHHMGNAVAPNPERPFELEEKGTQNLTDLSSNDLHRGIRRHAVSGPRRRVSADL